MDEIIVKMKTNHIKIKNGEYLRDLVRCKDCGNREGCQFAISSDDNAFCSDGEPHGGWY